jgi:hypothetical protein
MHYYRHRFRNFKSIIWTIVKGVLQLGFYDNILQDVLIFFETTSSSHLFPLKKPPELTNILKRKKQRKDPKKERWELPHSNVLQATQAYQKTHRLLQIYNKKSTTPWLED